MGEEKPPRIRLNRSDQGLEQSEPPFIQLNPSDLHQHQTTTEEHRPPRISLNPVFVEPVPTPIDPYAVTLGLDSETKQPIAVSQVDLCSGTYIVGVQGMGKTSLLEQIVYQQMQLNEAIIVIDPHGDLVNSILAHMPEQRLASTYLLDLKDRAYPFGLNAFTCRNPNDEEERDTTRSQVMHAFEKLWPETREGQYFNKILRHVIITLLENPELTLANVKQLLLDEEYRNQYTRRLKNSATRSFWQDEYNTLSESKRQTESSPLRGRLDQLLTEPVISNILRQTKKPLNIRDLIEERGILLVKLPVNEEAYKYSAPVIGTFLMSMIYSATFSFADIPMERRPGFTLIVDEFQNFATDEYAKLFEQGRKYKVKQFLAHQHRQQLERGSTGRTNIAATLTAHTIVAFRTIPTDSRDLAPLLIGIGDRRRPTDIYIHPLEKIDGYPHPIVKQFVLDVVDRLDKASGQKLATRGIWLKGYETARGGYRPGKMLKYKVDPDFDFGAGAIQASPTKAEAALNMLDRLIYECETQEHIVDSLKEEFIQAVTPFWKLDAEGQQVTDENNNPVTEYVKGEGRSPKLREPTAEDIAAARQRKTRFVNLLNTVLTILIHKPIANDATLSNTDIAALLEHQEKREAFVKTGSTAYLIETRDTRLLQERTTAQEAAQRLRQVREQTRARYCIPRAELTEREAEEPSEILPEEPQPETVQIETQEPEPIEVYEPETQPEPFTKTIVFTPPEPQPASMDTMNTLYAQLKAKTIDPDTTILASLGEHYVMTIRQWMRLFVWKTYPKATAHFKELRENGWIYHKDREGRGGKLVEGDWFFLLTKGANELVKRKQPTPLFTLEPNEAEKASGDTLVHTYLVNEVLIHLRLLEREHSDIVTIAGIDHERSIRRQYLAALGTDTKLYPDGFMRLLVPSPNGLKRRYTFLELQHTTQKDKHNWQTKVRKYLALFDRADTLAQFFSTRTPQVLVLTMDTEYVAYHKQWTEEVLAARGERGRAYGNRFLIGSYDPGISDNTVLPVQFFCTPRFSTPFQQTPHPFIGS